MTILPAWFARDVQRKARWLPDAVKRLGVDGAFDQRWNSLPGDVQGILGSFDLPRWMVALIPMDADKQVEILKQFRFMTALAGTPPEGVLAERAEALLIFGGSAQLPTPGDNATGASLGAEGCTAAMSKYVLAQLKLEFPEQLTGLPDGLTNCQSSVQMLSLFQQAARIGLAEVVSRPFAQLRFDDIEPGSLTIAQKPGGTHVFGWTRVAAGWGWDPSDRMAIGNTGLPQFGDRMILAQEFVTGNPQAPGELAHNQHGPINSSNIIYRDGKPDLTDPRTNVYAVKGANFVLIRLRDAAVA